MRKKIVKIILAVVAAALIIFILSFVNALFGNPVSLAIAKNSAKKYINETYSDRDFKVEDVGYNFKFGNYYAKVVSPSSTDTYFSVNITPFGKVKGDSYEDVTSGWNTYVRIETEYRVLCDTVLDCADFKYVSDIKFGELNLIEKDMQVDGNDPAYGVALSTLEVDYDYDVNELGKTAGNIILYVQDEEVSIQKAAKILLDVKQLFDKNKVNFYAIDFVLEKPKGETPRDDNERVGISDFLYSDIYEQELETRISDAHVKLSEYYEKIDKLK